MTAPVELMKTLPGESSFTPDEESSGIKFKDWGFKIDRLFEVAYRFYKRNESKAFHPSFDERNQLNALILQARYGNYDDSKAPDIGVLDLVGKNRRHRWSMLKGLSKMEAKSEFICTLDKICPLFKAYAEAVKLSSCVQLNTKLDETGRARSDSEIKRLDGSESKEQLNAIRTSLQKQTYSQFKIYAEKQYPDDLPKQRYLITTLQEQYYQQYISQMHSELNISSNGNSEENQKSTHSPSTSLSSKPSQTVYCDVTCDTIDDTVQSCQLAHSVTTNNVNNESIEQLETQRQEKLPESSDISLKLKSEAIVKENHTESREPSGDTLESSSNINHELVSNIPDVHKVVWNETDTSSELNHINDKIYMDEDNGVKINQSEFDKIAIGVFESYPEPKPIQSRAEYNFQSNDTINTTNSVRNYEQQTSEPDVPQLSKHQYLLQPADSVLASQDHHSELPLATEQNMPQTEILQNATTLESVAITPLPNTLNSSPQQRVQLPQSEADPWPCESSSGTSSPLQQSVTYESLEPATIWTKKGVHEFKDSLIDDKHGGAYVVKQGTLLTIQVPTYPDGKYIYWEFATEDYDIGFGLDFVYDNSLSTPLALRIYEDSDEDDDEEEEEEEEDNNEMTAESRSAPDSVEGANVSLDRERKQAEKIQKIANTVSIVPTYRRESHEEVFVGRHRYPGRGYYLLKFDNTYSVLRSKSLFFRICYFI